MMRQFAEPVSHWMIDAISPQPAQRVLELAAGLGETGMLAAEVVAPMGGVIISDQAEAMLAGARARAAELEMTNLEFKVFGGEWIDLPVASVDAVLCRFGYMLMTDPLAALTETRRVLRPGGRVALAVWDEPERNPWALLASMELIERGISTEPEKDSDHFQPGPFALSDPERVRSLLEQAGFTDVHLDKLDLEQRHASFEDFWETMLDISRSFHDLVLDRSEHEITEIREGVASRLAPFTSSDGSLRIPGRTIVGLATA